MKSLYVAALKKKALILLVQHDIPTLVFNISLAFTLFPSFDTRIGRQFYVVAMKAQLEIELCLGMVTQFNNSTSKSDFLQGWCTFKCPLYMEIVIIVIILKKRRQVSCNDSFHLIIFCAWKLGPWWTNCTRLASHL